jgi:hypothetical protein
MFVAPILYSLQAEPMACVIRGTDEINQYVSVEGRFPVVPLPFSHHFWIIFIYGKTDSTISRKEYA